VCYPGAIIDPPSNLWGIVSYLTDDSAGTWGIFILQEMESLYLLEPFDYQD